MAGMILAGDIGGTKTHLGLFRAVGRQLQRESEKVKHLLSVQGHGRSIWGHGDRSP